MRRNAVAVLHLVLVLFAAAGCQAGDAAAQADYTARLGFEADGTAVVPAGWGGGPAGTLFLDSVVVRGGRYAGRLERGTSSAGAFSAFTLSLPRSFAGDTLELRGWLRTEGVTGFAGLWLRQDGRDGSTRQFDNMQRRGLAGTTEWTEYRISLPLDDRTETVFLGALLAGEGTVWVDDLELLVDGRPAAEAPAYVWTPDAVELDREFIHGSGIETQPLSPLQVGNLALLGRVWGFVKYHHPRVAGGEVNWDFELFRVMPAILRAPDRTSAARELSSWLARLGEPQACDRCTELPGDLHLAPELDWIHDAATLGAELSARLDRIHRNRPRDGGHYYVSHARGVGNPIFPNEAPYALHRSPDAGYRMLSLFRFWNIIRYWFPYRDVMEEDWDGVLAEFVPRLMSAAERDDYHLALLQLVARVHDGHANLWRHLAVQPPQGGMQLPVVLRFVEGRAVVTGYSHPELGPATGLRVGDVIERIDGMSVDSLVDFLRPYYPASNQPTRLRDIARTLTRGVEPAVRVEGRRADGSFDLVAERAPLARLDHRAGSTHDLPGETFRMLSDDVAYLKLSSVVAADAPSYVRRAAGARALVIDIRNYPSEFVVFALGGHLVAAPTEFASFTRGDGSNPGAFRWREPMALQPLEPRFTGAVVVLVDETTQSQAEYTTMAFRAAPNTIVVGSTTAGADGNVSPIPLPGRVEAMISGIGVFYPDRTPTQRVGIVPDLEVRPTIAGIRAGRDEVLEAGVSRALGREFRLPRP